MSKKELIIDPVHCTVRLNGHLPPNYGKWSYPDDEFKVVVFEAREDGVICAGNREGALWLWNHDFQRVRRLIDSYEDVRHAYGHLYFVSSRTIAKVSVIPADAPRTSCIRESRLLRPSHF